MCFSVLKTKIWYIEILKDQEKTEWYTKKFSKNKMKDLEGNNKGIKNRGNKQQIGRRQTYMQPAH